MIHKMMTDVLNYSQILDKSWNTDYRKFTKRLKLQKIEALFGRHKIDLRIYTQNEYAENKGRWAAKIMKTKLKNVQRQAWYKLRVCQTKQQTIPHLQSIEYAFPITASFCRLIIALVLYFFKWLHSFTFVNWIRIVTFFRFPYSFQSFSNAS